MHIPLRSLMLLLPALLLASAPSGAAEPPKVASLLTKSLQDLGEKEAVMLTVEYAPGQSSPAHRHNAHTFVYVLQGAVIMGVQGEEPVRVEAGETFYEAPTDVHTISRNASESEPAKFLVFFIKDTGAPTSVSVQ
ncbi:MAG TPA: cupin domain-containing protein [Steroidobacter sp.]|jgi:quercetin dioxygenase-like cupin family protein